LKEIIQLGYNSEDRTVVLFKCDWFKLDGKKTEVHMMASLRASMLEVYGIRMIL
jgi:hypothetical protein